MTPTREQVIQLAIEHGIDPSILEAHCITTPFCSFANAIFAAGQQAEREKLELVAFLDLAKLSKGMAYATSFKVNEKQAQLYRIREEQ